MVILLIHLNLTNYLLEEADVSHRAKRIIHLSEYILSIFVNVRHMQHNWAAYTLKR